jgi:hypothetical protein
MNSLVPSGMAGDGASCAWSRAGAARTTSRKIKASRAVAGILAGNNKFILHLNAPQNWKALRKLQINNPSANA